MRKLWMIAGLGAGALAGAPGAMPVAFAADKGDSLEEVVVTAQRREEDLQKVSASIATVSGDDINEQGLTTAQDILKNVPGVEVVGTARGATVSIRGLGFDLPPQVGEASVAMNFDGIYNFRSESGTYGYFDLARVEVLRGPQGTYYGRNATGGVVNVISNVPTQQFGASGTLEVGNYDKIRAEGSVNVPISADWAARAAFVTINRNGFLSNGQNDAVGTGARLRTLFKPSEDFSLLTTLEYSKLGGHGPGTSTATDYSVSSDPSDYTSNYYLSYRIFTQMDARLGPGTLTFIPSYQYATGYNWSTGMGVFAQSVDPKDAKQKSGDLRYVVTTAANLQWVTGLYFYDKNDVGDAFGGTAYGTTRSYAGYANLTYPLTDTTRLIGGVRVSQDHKTYRLVDALGGETSGSDSRGTLDWKAGIEHDVTSQNLLYLTIATGHRPGGFNILADNTAPLTTPGSFYKPESLLSYEIGSKNRFLEDKLQLNGAVFFYDYKDYQLADIYSFVGGLHAEFINANAQIKGAEAEMVWLPVRDLRLNLAGTYLDAKLTQDVTRTFGGTTSTVFFNGDTLSHSPKFAARVGAEYEIPLTHGSLTPRAAWRYTDKQYVNAVNNDANLQDAYTGSDASLTYKSEDGKWTVNAYVNNISDKQVKTFLAGPTPQVSDPRTWGVVFNAKF